jgi:hypothetical protein
VHLISKNSDVKAAIGPDNRKNDKYGFEYCEDFRELGLKINDDRKVKINLGELMKYGKADKMLLLIVKCFDLKKIAPKAGEFDRAWFRL